ncbi:bifunctional 3-(3-hydroxy-phenyl)propionate/3-hydroxycinnamic acid hydroxylase [Actinomadura livida]|uniref:3-(3-hydroxy-phenyl)propionate hydroxylase n=1 Tax=Actinomadura livida TaxID=79909 RepID=A0A7W7MZD4_9ACTN|nr:MULTISPECIES: bifunctional 3-(3-hydroxy-phenyl)propionate/3-hydroxycinnamic acid hydroxylase [Actinomadura]MBB4775924.1 3-(3-hydroxy-phenyl)propionate hydroxylase [Actinomadura catellatispora]GGU16733.1 3-(3-hydroxy-phenyl)propionate/3-hydroxycinnamic acid hydroxylase [Actinomadura livida]
MSDERPGPADRGTDAETEVLVVGAGPVGLTLANILGMHGRSVTVVESRETLIDYPRGVGLDDESLRTFQGIGLVDEVRRHTIPNQIMRFVDGRGELLAEMAPRSEELGWPKRNGFVQPLVDAELLAGLDRHPTVRVRWATTLERLDDDGSDVTVSVRGADGSAERLRADYVVGCDGGRSSARRMIGTTFDGTTSSTRWLVIDLADDPLGSPNSYVGADPVRPYASISIAHGIRRFEFMINDDESDAEAGSAAFARRLLAARVPRPDDVKIIRHRVYTHHSRIAGTFRKGRVLLAGDAAHLMPVWQGQGYNSGIRDAANLGWKLAAVLDGRAGDGLLDTYDAERRGHARAMIDLSTTVGKVISVRNPLLARLRDGVARRASLLPWLKQYIVEMRFKPMPRYERGALVPPDRPDSPVGRLFVQPRVRTADRPAGPVLLDEVAGNWFAVLSWNNDPAAILSAESRELWGSLGARFIRVVPAAQLGHATAADGVVIVGDDGALKAWFDRHRESVVFLRPDRFVAGAAIAQDADAVTRKLAHAMRLVSPDTARSREGAA